MDASQTVAHIHWLVVPVAAIAGFMAGFTFVAAALGITHLFEFRSLKPGASTRAIRWSYLASWARFSELGKALHRNNAGMAVML